MFSGLSAAPTHAKVGVGFGFLLTAIPLALAVSIVVKMIVSPPTSGGTWAVLVLAVLFIAAFGLAGFRATQLVAAGNRLGCVIFYRPAYVLLMISLLDMVRSFTAYGGGLLTFLGGLGLAALCGTALGFYRWLATVLPAGGWGGPMAPAADPASRVRQLTAAERSDLEQVVREIPPVAAEVVTGDTTFEEATRRVASIAHGSAAMLSEAARIYADQAAKTSKDHVRTVARESARLAADARRRVLAESPQSPTGP